MIRVEGSGLLRGAFRVREVERNEVVGLVVGEDRDVVRRDCQVRTEAPCGLDERSGAISGTRKKEKEARTAHATRPGGRYFFDCAK
jgi:hypothetical protein